MTNLKVLALCCLAGLAACHKDAGSASAVRVVPHARKPAILKAGPTVAEQTAGMVEAVTQGRSQLPVELKFDLPQRPTVGQPLEVDIAIVPQIAAAAADVQISQAGGLGIASGAKSMDLSSIELGQVYKRSIQVTPSTEGVQFLSLVVTLQHDEISESRAFAIPIIVASATELAAISR